MTDIEIQVVLPFAWQTLSSDIPGPRFVSGPEIVWILNHVGEVI